jgi:hypothetical protein
VWDGMDELNGLRWQLAKIIASKHSGLSLDTVIPSKSDFELADALSELIDKEIESI